MKTKHICIIGDSRRMDDIESSSAHLIVTSPPYWQLKDYGSEEQIGFNDSYEEYINNLNLVWKECYRVLNPGCRMAINNGVFIKEDFKEAGLFKIRFCKIRCR